MAYRIGSFNMRNLNYRSDKEVNRNFELISQIIRKEKFDIVAMQEVLTDGIWKNGLGKYLTQNNRKECWNFSWEQPRKSMREESTDDSGDRRGEGYAFIWNSNRVNLITTKDPYGKDRIFWPRIWKQYPKNGGKLVREPYYARFCPVNGPFCEFRLICTHIVYGGNVLGRKEEFKKLAEGIYPNIADKRYGTNRAAYTVILGDYNLTSRQIESVTLSESRQSRTIITLQNLPTTLSRGGEEGGEKEEKKYSNHDYDHFSIDERQEKKLGLDVERVDAVSTYCKGDFQTYFTEVSDHVPIRMTIDMKKRGER